MSSAVSRSALSSMLRPTASRSLRVAAAIARPGREWARVGLAALGVSVSSYLTWVHYSGAEALCTGAGGCEAVQSSQFAVVAGLPVATLGLSLYLGLLALSLRLVRGGADAPWAGLGLFGLSLAGTLYSLYLTYLELFVIHAICPWCVSSAVMVTAIFALTIPGLVAAGRAEE